ncbi:MAG: Gx transporter family protein [Oscillospiraceae bacterium]|jgi:heptaprenyl diphosphate synthase|nr:Gx transporter family protein [Oscillospiraceae bacterium]
MNREGLVRRVTLDGMLFALAVVLSIVEGMIPVPAPVPGARIGLANITVMYAAFFAGRRDALVVAALKGMFAFITRGAVAGALSLSGGILSAVVMIALVSAFRERVSYVMLSVAGAVAHNAGQLVVIRFIYSSLALAAYAPMLVASGIVSGIITAAILRALLPAARRFGMVDRYAGININEKRGVD